MAKCTLKEQGIDHAHCPRCQAAVVEPYPEACPECGVTKPEVDAHNAAVRAEEADAVREFMRSIGVPDGLGVAFAIGPNGIQRIDLTPPAQNRNLN